MVVSAVAGFLRRPDRLITAIDTDQVAPNNFERAVAIAKRAADELTSEDASRRREIIAELIGRVVISDGNVRVDLLAEEIASLTGLPFADGSDHVFKIDVPVQLRLRGVELKLVMAGGDTYRQRLPDPALVKVVVRAREWGEQLLAGEVASASELARCEGLTKGYVLRLLPFAFLAPDITKAILEGAAPIELTARRLTRAKKLPASWVAQRQMLGFPAAK